MPDLDDASMENCKAEISDWFWEWRRVSQLSPKQRALWHLEQDIKMLADLKGGRGTLAGLALWIIEGGSHVDRILARGTPDFNKLDATMDALWPLATDFVADFNRRMFLPAIDSAASILLHCKTTLEAWTDEKFAEKFSAIILQFPDGSPA